jgi:hypothetical protein
MLDLLTDEPRAAANLIQKIVTKADGVFLWVLLVVKSLLDRLRDGDHTIDLQRRLNNTPLDLESLYKYMLSRIGPNYAVQASQIFQIVHSYFNGNLTYIFKLLTSGLWVYLKFMNWSPRKTGGGE